MRPPKTVIFQRGEYTKPMGFDGWFFKGGGEGKKIDGIWLGFGVCFIASKSEAPGAFISANTVYEIRL